MVLKCLLVQKKVTLPYENSLNGIPTCWTIEDNNNGDYWSWRGGSGLTQLETSMADSYAPDTARLFTPEFNFDKAYVMNIEMYTYYETGTFNVLFDNGTTRDTIVAGYQHHNDWETCTYDMSEYVGQTGRIVFEGWGPQLTSGWTAYWYIRNISIVEPPVQYVVAGTSALTGFDWNNSENVMALNAETGLYSLTFSNVPAGEHQFKVSEFANWNAAYGYANLAADNTTNVYEISTNIAFTLAEAADVTIEFNAEAKTIKVTTTGNFVEPVNLLDIYVAGSAGLCNGVNWDPGAAVNKLVYDEATGEYVKVFSNVAAGTYEFKVASPGWAAEYTDVDAECSDEGWEKPNNIKFTLAETADVTIKLTTEGKVCLTSTLGEFGEIEITSYTLVGDTAIFGTRWNTLDENNNMVQEGETATWTKVYENVLLDSATYYYKVVGNHAYEIFQYPGHNAELVIAEAGYYTVTFTFVAGENPSLTANVVKYEAPAAPAVPTIQYGGGYFTADMLPVAVNTTETRPAYILVTIDGSEPSFEGAQAGTTLPAAPGQQIQLAETATVKVRGMLVDVTTGRPYQNPDGTYVYSEIAEATFTKVSAPAAPEFTPVAGEYTDSVRVSIACATENVMIKYEFGGTEPTGRSATYTEPFKLTSTTVVSAIAFLTDAEGAPIMDVEEMPIASLAAFAEYKVTPYVAPAAPAVPTIQYGGGYFTADMLPVAVNTTETRPAYILVTIDGSEPSFEGAQAGTTLPAAPGQQIQLAETATVKVRGMLVDVTTGRPYQNPDGTYVYSEIAEATFTKVSAPAAPEFTPVAGEYTDSVRVSIACATENVMVKYEFGGTEPTGRSATYTEPFKLTETTTVSAIAYLVDGEGALIMTVEELPVASAATFATYTVKPEVVTVSAPVFTPAPGDYLDKESMTVTLHCSTPDALIYWAYGKDASVNQYSFAYENPIPVDAKNNVISAVAILMDDNLKVVAKSEVVYATYNLKAETVKPVEIRFNPAPGEYEGEVTVSIEYINAEGVAMKLYSIDGTDPMREYKDPIKLTETTTVKARVLLSMSPMTFSETVEATYTIKPKDEPIVVSAPVFTPAPGDYLDKESMAVTLYCSTPDALIYWTYGEDASVNQYSYAYENPIPVDANNNVISAVAILMDENLKVVAKSEVVYAAYNLKEETVKPVEIRFSPEPGEYETEVTVVIDYINAENAMMKVYSTDGTDPMREYKDPITLTETTTVKARVLLSMSPMTFSETVEATYVIVPGTGVGMDEAQLAAVVYAKDGFVYVATQQGAMVEVFTVQGQCIYSAEAATDLVTVDALNADVVLVRVNGETVKVSVK